MNWKIPTLVLGSVVLISVAEPTLVIQKSGDNLSTAWPSAFSDFSLQRANTMGGSL